LTARAKFLAEKPPEIYNNALEAGPSGTTPAPATTTVAEENAGDPSIALHGHLTGQSGSTSTDNDNIPLPQQSPDYLDPTLFAGNYAAPSTFPEYDNGVFAEMLSINKRGRDEEIVVQGEAEVPAEKRQKV